MLEAANRAAPKAMSHQQTGAVLFTINFRRLAQFYEQVAGLRVRRTEYDHIVLENDSFRLVVHQIPERYAKHIAITVPPQVREIGSIKLCFPVDSISAAREEAASLGGCVYGSEREWIYESATVCDGWDSDGNVFQLSQPITQNSRQGTHEDAHA